ncbi:MAG: IS701 family transposase, partial [Planctomycetes bacterium]|nr:IS701 family transposase [Planctomycetota bacterium]
RLKALRKELDTFVSSFAPCIKTEPSRRHFKTYVEGQVSDLERKNVAAIALNAGVSPRTLQEFVGLHVWDHLGARDELQRQVMVRHADPNAIADIDESGFAKKGEKTAGVKRQYCGATGKVDNCVVTVHLGYVAKDFHTLLDGDLYLPEDWLADRERCREAGIPDSVVFRTKWEIALDLLDRALANGVRFKWLTADEHYGGCGAFRDGVGERGLTYVVEVPCSLTGWTKRPRVVIPAKVGRGAGRPPCTPRLACDAPEARPLKALWKRGGPTWKGFHVKNTQAGPVVWEARVVRFFPAAGGLPGEPLWLLVARNVLDQEIKYFYSNAPEDTPPEVLLHVAFSRCHIEQLFEESKGEVGLDHFEMRKYLAIRRHLVLSMVSLLFLEEQTERLRGKKSVVEPCGRAFRRGGAIGP